MTAAIPIPGNTADTILVHPRDGGARKSPAPTRVPKALKVLPSIK